MGKKVRLPDGRYCYTENCKVHDRSYVDSTGATAVIADTIEHRRADLSNLLYNQLITNGFDIGKKETDQISDTVFNEGTLTGAQLNNYISEKLENNPTPQETNKLLDVAYTVQAATIQGTMIYEKDEVLILETGERGRVSEGSTAFGSMVRVDTDNPDSPNSFSWFSAGQVVRVPATIDPNRRARENVLCVPRDTLISGKEVARMFDQETFDETVNPQGLRGVPEHLHPIVREEFLDMARRVERGFEKGVTRPRVIRFIREELELQRPWLAEDEQKAVKVGLGNLYNYLTSYKA